MIYFKVSLSKSLLKKIPTVEVLIQSKNKLESFQNFWNSHSLLKSLNFSEPGFVDATIWKVSNFELLKFFLNWSIQSRKWYELLQSFIYQIACFKKIKLLKFRFSLEKNVIFFRKFWSSLSLFKNSNFSETGSVYETVWKSMKWIEKAHNCEAQIACLKISKFSWTDSVFK